MLAEQHEAVFGIQAAAPVGVGASILPDVAILPEHRVPTKADGFPPITNTQIALAAAPNVSRATRRPAEVLVAFCSTDPRKAAGAPRRPRGRRRHYRFTCQTAAGRHRQSRLGSP
ncbi:MAG: hypothetical protein K2Y27_14700 [Xanthobacteraceae bacterium]|nr:hypothetical protein [Xanthobacteraceae bacterium]